MGTNFYLRKKASNIDKEKILSYLDSEYEKLRKQVSINIYDLDYSLENFCYEIKLNNAPYTEEIHIGKRSYGWQFLWDYHKGKYFEANLESIKKFLSNPLYEIANEYGEVFTLEQFFDEEVGKSLYEGSTGQEDGLDRYHFISDNLRFSIYEDFS